MRIGIVGSGHIGGTLARLFTRAGHTVVVSNSRGPESLKDLIDELGPTASAGTVSEAAEASEVVVIAIPWRATDSLPAPKSVAGKIVIDAMNPYQAGGEVDFGDSTSSEETAKRLPGARLVKAFNTTWYKHLADNGRVDLPVDERHAIFLASDDVEAKSVVSSLIESIGFAPVDTGTLRTGGRRQRVGSPIYNVPMTGSKAREIVAALPA